MKTLMLLFALTLPLMSFAQDQKAVGLKAVLLEQLRTVHNKNGGWFVPASVAVDGVSAEQAKWTDGKGNHSVGQLTYHLLFWNRRALATFKGEKQEKFNGTNDQTFTDFDSQKWSETVQQLDQVMTDWEKAVEEADESQINKEASTISQVAGHMAYHIGQIVYVRKEQSSWDASKGVK
jgi:hypothetical protein